MPQRTRLPEQPTKAIQPPRRRIACLCAAALFLAAASPRDTAAKKLKQAEADHQARLHEAAEASQKAQDAQAREVVLAQQRVAMTAKLRETESQVDAASRQSATATSQANAARQDVAKLETDLAALLPLAIRLADYPAETLLAAPAPPEQALEGLLAAKSFSAALAQKAATLRRRQTEARQLADTAAQQAAILDRKRETQAQQEAALDQQISAAERAEAAARDAASIAAREAASLAAKASDLRGAIAAMEEAERQAAAREAARAEKARRHNQDLAADAAAARAAAIAKPAGPGLATTTLKTTLVAGHMVRAWGAAADDGPATGITFATAPAAYVSSPCAGRVAFAAPFRSYGKLMIIDCGAGYDFVLAGLARFSATVGQPVKPGEPVGRMADAGGGLYVELRKAGQAVDPAPYLQSKG